MNKSNFSFSIMTVNFLIFRRYRARIQRLNIIYERLLFQESQLILRETFTLKLLNVLKSEFFTTDVQFSETQISFELTSFLNSLFLFLNVFKDALFEIFESMSSQKIQKILAVNSLLNLQ